MYKILWRYGKFLKRTTPTAHRSVVTNPSITLFLCPQLLDTVMWLKEGQLYKDPLQQIAYLLVENKQLISNIKWVIVLYIALFDCYCWKHIFFHVLHTIFRKTKLNPPGKQSNWNKNPTKVVKTLLYNLMEIAVLQQIVLGQKYINCYCSLFSNAKKMIFKHLFQFIQIKNLPSQSASLK